MGNGFKPVSVRDEIYSVASDLAEQENKSIAEVVSEAIQNYKDYKQDMRKKVTKILEILEAQETK